MFAKIYYFCAMRFLTADYLFPLHLDPIKNGVLQISDKGKILSISNSRADIPTEKLEIFDGILCPGFVNTHCHLELSHLHAKLPKGLGLVDFISRIPAMREKDLKLIQESAKNADSIMRRNGIVGVGDISNTSNSFSIKDRSTINYHTFVEVFGVKSCEAEDIFQSGIEKLSRCPEPKSLVPHATYSVSSELYSKINSHNTGEIICIHNQETSSEDEVFSNSSGKLYDYLKGFGNLNIKGDSALQSILLKLPIDTPIILVHNTFTKKNDIDWISAHGYSTYFCTCPKANLYIEDSLPDYSIFDITKLCVGTDSLASNETLSILDELRVIKENSNFDINTLLKIGSKNGAKALGFSDLGTFERGKTPGVNLIKDFKYIDVIR